MESASLKNELHASRGDGVGKIGRNTALPEIEYGLWGHEIDRRFRQAVRVNRLAENVLAFYLDEIARRKLWRVLGYSSAMHYGRMVSGFGERKIYYPLHIGRRMEELGSVRKAFVSDRISWTKVCEIVKVATPDTEQEWLRIGMEKNCRELREMVDMVRRSSREGKGRKSRNDSFDSGSSAGRETGQGGRNNFSAGTEPHGRDFCSEDPGSAKVIESNGDSADICNNEVNDEAAGKAKNRTADVCKIRRVDEVTGKNNCEIADVFGKKRAEKVDGDESDRIADVCSDAGGGGDREILPYLAEKFREARRVTMTFSFSPEEYEIVSQALKEWKKRNPGERKRESFLVQASRDFLEKNDGRGRGGDKLEIKIQKEREKHSKNEKELEKVKKKEDRKGEESASVPDARERRTNGRKQENGG